MRYLILFILLPCVLHAQAGKEITSLTAKADGFFKEKKYDSALTYDLRAIQEISKAARIDTSTLFQAPPVLLQAGQCYRQLGKYQEANKYDRYALQQSRALASRSDLQNAMAELNDLHQFILEKDIAFNYPTVALTEQVPMFFSILEVKQVSADSLRLVIGAGHYDGVSDSMVKGGIISRYETPERPYGLVNAWVRQVGDNHTIAMAKYDTSRLVKKGDLIELKVRVPVYWRKLDVRPFLIYSISLADNYRQRLINPRYLYYYADSLTNHDLVDLYRLQIEEIADLLAEDTATDRSISVRAKKGLFEGQNVMRALLNSREEHLRLFTNFVAAYPRKYMGFPYKFSETYATWIVNNTPLALQDIRPLIANERSAEKRRAFAGELADDITAHRLVDRWFNEGMQLASADNLDSAAWISDAIHDACLVLNDRKNKGWGTYLAAYVQRRYGNYERADSLFHSCLKEFTQSNNKEGITWASSAIANLQKGKKVALSMQTGHLFNYSMAASPNSNYLATAGYYDRLIKIWDLRLGREVASFSGHDDYINSIHYSPNGKYIVTASEDKTIKLWNAYDYTLIRTIPTKAAQLAAIFTPDGQQLVAGGRDSVVKFLDLETGAVLRSFKKHKGAITQLCFLPTNPDYLFSAGTDSMIYKWDLTSNDWDHWYKEHGEILTMDITSDGKYLYALCDDTTIQVRNLETHYNHFEAWPHVSRNTGDFAAPAFTPDGKYMVFAYHKDSIDVVELATKNERVYGMPTPPNTGIFDLTFTPDGNFLAARIGMGGPLRIINFSSWDFTERPTINFNELKNYYNIPTEVQFSSDDNQLYIVHDRISSLDLRNGTASTLYYGVMGYQNNHFILDNDREGLYVDSKQNAIQFFNYRDVQIEKEYPFPDPSEKLTRYELSSDNKRLFMGGDQHSIVGFDLLSGERLFSVKIPGEEDKGIGFIRYDSLRQRLLAFTNNNTIHLVDARNGQLLKKFDSPGPVSIEVTRSKIYIASEKSRIYVYDAVSLQKTAVIDLKQGDESCQLSAVSPDGNYLVVQAGRKFYTIDLRNNRILYSSYDHDYENGVMAISHDGRLLATGGFDSKVNLYELKSGKKLATIFTPRDKDFVIADQDNRYIAPKNSLEALSFQYNSASYPFEQFDTRFNRPDIVLKELGRADSVVLKTFRMAFTKRLKKLGVSESDLSGELHLPKVRILDRYAMKPATSVAEYQLKILCHDDRYSLRSVQVMVNNNPLFGSKGKPIEGDLKDYMLSTTVPLAIGNNSIKVFCTNSKGVISLMEAMEVNSTYKPAIKPKTYFIGIAVSHYRDSTMNLRFAAKDVRDLARMFDTLQNNYEADTLIDAMATRENILALREKLMKTNVDDKVIISVNGHGLLDDSLDFYYGTYDMDFKAPSKRGLKYEDLEGLLDGIPARKKLLLIDACHSGAVDKEELRTAKNKDTVQIKNEVTGEGTVKGFAPRGTVIVSSATSVDAGSSYELMQNLFADIGTNNGAVVISAAGGMEYAFESDTWNNGVFTYCIIRGIVEEKADKIGGNNDGIVQVNELKNYVSRKVSELTNGRQKPVSRRENLDFDWTVY